MASHQQYSEYLQHHCFTNSNMADICFELFIESEMQSNSELKEARDYLNNAIQKIKQEDMRFEDKTVSVISHSE